MMLHNRFVAGSLARTCDLSLVIFLFDQNIAAKRAADKQCANQNFGQIVYSLYKSARRWSKLTTNGLPDLHYPLTHHAGGPQQDDHTYDQTRPGICLGAVEPREYEQRQDERGDGAGKVRTDMHERGHHVDALAIGSFVLIATEGIQRYHIEDDAPERKGKDDPRIDILLIGGSSPEGRERLPHSIDDEVDEHANGQHGHGQLKRAVSTGALAQLNKHVQKVRACIHAHGDTISHQFRGIRSPRSEHLCGSYHHEEGGGDGQDLHIARAAARLGGLDEGCDDSLGGRRPP
mmetsp:Transcript_2078/g.6064  ORF Transcript_2078/g.6064 Transcript_2078/m.6064 type:complete len:290 (-) Transcript_2078:239-1108(-)